MAYLSLKATLLTEDIPPDGFVNENFPKLFLSKFSKNSLYYSTSLRQEKGKKMVIHERVSLFILLVLRCAWPLGDITAVESCMRWRLTDNEHLDLTFYQRLYSTSFGRLPKELDVARIV